MLTLVIGGASSGKSAVAENICMSISGRKAYIATMLPFGEQAGLRIERHLKLREGKGMDTIECHTDISSIALKAADYDVLLIEDMTNLVANEIFNPDAEPNADHAKKIYNDTLQIGQICPELVIVTCDVFCGGTAYEPETLEYMRCLGRLNQMLATAADRVVEVWYGLATDIKGGLNEPH